MRPRSGGSAEALWISQLIIQLYKVEYEYPAIMYGYLDSWLFCTLKNLLDRLASLAFFWFTALSSSSNDSDIFLRSVVAM